MKKSLLISGAVLTTTLISATAQADEILVGAKAAMVDYDVQNSDAGINGTFTLGYEFLNLGAADLAVEGELSLPVLDTEINNVDRGFESLGVFAALRTAGPVYFVGRAGLVNGEIDPGTDDTEPALGAGVGFSGGGLRWEVEYTAYEVENVDVDAISVGLSF